LFIYVESFEDVASNVYSKTVKSLINKHLLLFWSRSGSSISILSDGSLQDTWKDFLVFSSEWWEINLQNNQVSEEKPDFGRDFPADQIQTEKETNWKRRKIGPKLINVLERET
jgi:hypothetical protein